MEASDLWKYPHKSSLSTYPHAYQISFSAKLWPRGVLKRRLNREGAAPFTLVPHFFGISSTQCSLTCFPLDSAGFPHMSEWLWVPTFCPGQGQSQPGEFIPNLLRKAPELASRSVSLGWETRLPLIQNRAATCYFHRHLKLKRRGLILPI